ncbi:MAG: acyl-CoA dehydrogenase family protein, partial [bacterium]
AANLLTFKAAWLYDNGRPCGAEANAAKLLGAEMGFKATDQAMQTLGGMGYAKEFHVERYWRESKLLRIAPVSPELILCDIAERAPGLPKSYCRGDGRKGFGGLLNGCVDWDVPGGYSPSYRPPGRCMGSSEAELPALPLPHGVSDVTGSPWRFPNPRPPKRRPPYFFLCVWPDTWRGPPFR